MNKTERFRDESIKELIKEIDIQLERNRKFIENF